MTEETAVDCPHCGHPAAPLSPNGRLIVIEVERRLQAHREALGKELRELRDLVQPVARYVELQKHDRRYKSLVAVERLRRKG